MNTSRYVCPDAVTAGLEVVAWLPERWKNKKQGSFLEQQENFWSKKLQKGKKPSENVFNVFKCIK